MTRTLVELQEYLKANATEDDLLDVLDISVEDLVDMFDYKIEEHFEKIQAYFGLDEEDDELEYTER